MAEEGEIEERELEDGEIPSQDYIDQEDIEGLDEEHGVYRLEDGIAEDDNEEMYDDIDGAPDPASQNPQAS